MLSKSLRTEKPDDRTTPNQCPSEQGHLDEHFHGRLLCSTIIHLDQFLFEFSCSVAIY